MLIHLIAAARPNFMKIAPLFHALKKEPWAKPIIVHTGQHYDLNMSDAFFLDLQLPEPHIHLGVGSGSHAEQTGRVMMAYEKILLEHQPDLVIVVGDVNSTLACTLAASKITYTARSGLEARMPGGEDARMLGGRDADVPITEDSAPASQPPSLPASRPLVAHLEAGLRSFDRSMPEEINRIVTDSLADILWTPSPDGDENLLKEGIAKQKICRVGNIMIDSLEMLRDKIEADNTYEKYHLKSGEYGLVTLHRPSNVDDAETLESLCRSLTSIALKCPLLFSVHPRTRKNLEEYNLLPILAEQSNLIMADPINYISFMNLVFNCRFVLTDSGGIQEETSYLGIPCLTLRPNTERPITIDQGTNQLCDPATVERFAFDIIEKSIKKNVEIELWDGQTAGRILQHIQTSMLNS